MEKCYWPWHSFTAAKQINITGITLHRFILTVNSNTIFHQYLLSGLEDEIQIVIQTDWHTAKNKQNTQKLSLTSSANSWWVLLCCSSIACSSCNCCSSAASCCVFVSTWLSSSPIISRNTQICKYRSLALTKYRQCNKNVYIVVIFYDVSYDFRPYTNVRR
jgi:hypothetical protein